MRAIRDVLMGGATSSSRGWGYQAVDNEEQTAAVEMAGISSKSALEDSASVTVSISVKGMTCAACSGAVEKALRSVET
jgi:hypothetical protein